MGFYSIYKIIKDFLRKPFRTLFIISIVIIVIIIFSSSSFAATYYPDGAISIDDTNKDSLTFPVSTDDITNYLNLRYRLAESNFLFSCNVILSRNTNSGAISVINNFMRQIANLNYYTYFWQSSYINADQFVYVGLYKAYSEDGNLSRGDLEAFGYQMASGDFVPYDGYKVPYYMGFTVDTYNVNAYNDGVPGVSHGFLPIPVSLYNIRTDLMTEFLNKWYYKTDNTFDEKLSDIQDNTSLMANLLGMINTTNNETLEATKDMVEEQKKMNDFFKKEDVDNSSYDFNTNNPTDDITSSGFDNIFQQFYDAFTSDQKKKINIPIPFANKNISFDSDFLYNALGQNSWIVQTMKVFWLFLVSLYVVKDVEKYIEKMKNGDIVSTTDTNIKTDML